MALGPTLLPIKPGAYCYLRGFAHDRMNGRQVTAIARQFNARVLDKHGKVVICADCWIVAAPWLPHGPVPWSVDSRNLVPITNPDEIVLGLARIARDAERRRFGQ